jgi:hypothetical protein
MRSVFYDKNTTTESFWSGMYKHPETYKELAVVAIGTNPEHISNYSDV